MDSEGNIWQAIYGDSKVVKIKDVNGKGVVVGEVRYPTKAITCPVFVGSELWVTTAGGENDGGDGDRYKGAVYKVDVGVKGLKDSKFKLDKKI